jgi:hypothetical protein
MIKLSLQMNIAHEGEEYQLVMNVERNYGREPLAGELVFLSQGDPPLAVRVQSISWFPDHCAATVEPAHGVTPCVPSPASSLEEIQQYVDAGFRCPWTGYPDGVTAPE